MKKEERLHRLFGDIDADLVADAAPKPIPLRVWLPRVTAAVAAVALTVGILLTQPWASEKPPIKNGGTTVTTITTTPDGNGEESGNVPDEPGVPIASAPDDIAPPKPTYTHKSTGTTIAEIGNPDIGYEQPWSEWPMFRKFSHFDWNGTDHKVQETPIAASYVEEHLGEVELHGYDGPNETAHTAIGHLYRIKAVNPTAAIALQYEGENEYYPVINDKYFPETLGQLLDDFHLREYLAVGIVHDDRMGEDGQPNHWEYHGLTVEALWSLLMKDTSLPNMQDQELVFDADKLYFLTTVPLLGNYQIYMGVTTDGYFFADFGALRKAFFVGENTVNEFISYLEEHCRVVKPTTNNTNIVTDTTMTSPAQPPLETETTVQKPR